MGKENRSIRALKKYVDSQDVTLLLSDGATIKDTSSNELVKFTKVSSAVNELNISNAASGNAPIIAVSGEGENIGLQINQKAVAPITLGMTACTGVKMGVDQPILDSSDNELIKFTKAATAINEVTIGNAASGNAPSVKATGATNVALLLAGKGTGAVQLGQATSTGVQLIADQPILDSAGLELLKFVKTSTAVDEITITNAAANGKPSIAATGDDTDIDLVIAGKGTGNVELGQATSGGVLLVADQPILDSAGLELLKFTKTTTAVNELTIANAATGGTPSIIGSGESNVPVLLAGKGTGAVKLGQATSEGVLLVADQPILDSAGLELLKFTKVSTAVNELTVANAATGGIPSIIGSGETNVSVLLAGKGTGAVQLGQATSTGVQLMADQAILDSSGLELVKFTKVATAVNEITIANAATGNAPSITGSGESDVGINIVAKGAGNIGINALDPGFDTATHDYAAGATAWTLSAKEIKALFVTATNANGAVDAICTAVAGRLKVVSNATGQALTFKASGQTGIIIANTKTAILKSNGTDWVRVTADC